MQLATAFSVLANGGNLVSPRLVKSVLKGGQVVRETQPNHVRRVIAESTARQATNILQGVVTRGTGKGAAVEGYSVAGKTGTAQKFDSTLGRYSPQKSVASFVGYLPADRPRVTILVSLDEPQGEAAWGGVAAAPVFSAVATPIMRYLRVPADGNQPRVAETPVARLPRAAGDSALVTLSAENFVGNVRDMMRDMMGQMTTYVWGRFLTVDVKDVRKSRRKAERSDR